MKKIIISTLISSMATIPLVPFATSCSISNSNISSSANDNETSTEIGVDSTDENDTIEENGISSIIVSFEKRDESQSDVTFVGPTRVKARLDKPFAMVEQPIAYHNQYVVSYWVNRATGARIKNTDLLKNLVSSGQTTLSVYPYFDNEVILRNCLGISAIQDSTITIVHHGDETKKPLIQYSTNGLEWFDYEFGFKPLTIKSGEVLYFKGNNPNGFSSSENEYTSFSIGGAVNINGNIMTLLDNGIGQLLKIPNSYCFYRLFQDCSGIVSISSNFLPATSLADHCYAYMFEDCDSLSNFPSVLLSATELRGADYDGSYCYQGMFMNCKGIKKIPYHLLKATKLAPYCYMGMFYGCTGLTELDDDVFHSTTLADGCYSAMFANCTSLVNIDDNLLWPDTGTGPNLTKACYSNMFANCTGLTDLSGFKLSASNLKYDPTTSIDDATYCYQEMFYGCTNLKAAPELPATILSDYCYENMFYNCTSLPDHINEPTPENPGGAPLLNAGTTEGSTLAPGCYKGMFTNCFALTTMPVLAATTLAESCYERMFENCFSTGTTGFSFAGVQLPAKVLSKSCYKSMFEKCTMLLNTPSFPTDTMTVAESCCESMFKGCYSLTSSPALNATQAATSCYESMFENCCLIDTATGEPIKGLTSAGHISISSFATDCCKLMFSGNELMNVNQSTYLEPENYIIYIPYSSSAMSACFGLFQDTVNWLHVGFASEYGYFY